MANLKDIISRYESEEDEYTRELEQMRVSLSQNSSRGNQSEADDEGDAESDDVPQDPQPILSVLCDLVDEIGTLRNENRRLKTRLSLPRPRSRQTVVERMSALLDASGSIFPRLKKAQATATTPRDTSANSTTVNGARERLSTPPPRKDPLTASSLSTDFSSLDSGRRSPRPSALLPPRPVPLVQPEASDSDFDENIFEESAEEGAVSSSASECNRKARRDTQRPLTIIKRRDDHSLSDCTSPSSASSSRDVSEVMTTSRSSFLELIGVKKRRELPSGLSLLGVQRSLQKRRRQRRASEDENELHDANGEVVGRKRENNNKRLSCRFGDKTGDGGIGDKHRSAVYGGSSTSTSASPYPASARSEEALLSHVLTRHTHEKDNLRAEIEELRTRNSRLIEQLREKSLMMGHVQNHAKSLEKQVESLRQRCALSEALDKLTLDERMAVRPTRLMEKIEERLRLFEAEMQTAKVEANSAHQMTLSACTHERTCYRNCLEQIERLQKENFCLIRGRLIDSDDSTVRHRLAMMPSYDALYSFSMRVVRKLGVIRQTLLERNKSSKFGIATLLLTYLLWLAKICIIFRCTELSRTEVDLIAAQSSLLVTHAQIERLKLQQKGNVRRKRTNSWHGVEGSERRAHHRMNFFLPFRLQGSRAANSRQAARILPKEVVADGIENEFIALFGYAKALSRITSDHRQSSQTTTRRHQRLSPSPPQQQPIYMQPPPVLPMHRIQRHPSNGGQSSRRTRWPTPKQVLATTRQEMVMQPPSHQNHQSSGHRRPVSLVEVEDRLYGLGSGIRQESRRRSTKGHGGASAHTRVGSGGGDGEVVQRERMRRSDENAKKADVRAVASLQDVSTPQPRTPTGTPVLTRRLAPQTTMAAPRSSIWTSSDHAEDGYSPVLRREDDRRATKIERSRPLQSRRPPSHLRSTEGSFIMKREDRGPQLSRTHRPQSPETGSPKSSDPRDSAELTAHKSHIPKMTPPTSPKSSRLPMMHTRSPPQNEQPQSKGLSWLSKLKHYKNK